MLTCLTQAYMAADVLIEFASRSGNIDLWKLYVEKGRRIWHDPIAQTVRGWVTLQKVHAYVHSVVLACRPVSDAVHSHSFQGTKPFSQMSAPNLPVRSTLNTSNLPRGCESQAPHSGPCLRNPHTSGCSITSPASIKPEQ